MEGHLPGTLMPKKFNLDDIFFLRIRIPDLQEGKDSVETRDRVGDISAC